MGLNWARTGADDHDVTIEVISAEVCG